MIKLCTNACHHENINNFRNIITSMCFYNIRGEEVEKKKMCKQKETNNGIINPDIFFILLLKRFQS